MPNLMEFHQKGANGIANSEDPDKTASLVEQSDQGLPCLPFYLHIFDKFLNEKTSLL